METVQELIIQYKEKASKLNLEETDLVLDHAIYAKALEYLLREENLELHHFINLRMGGFHATCIFLGVIGKRFGDGGLRDLAVEAGIVGQGNVEQALKGKQYNNAIRMHTIVAEAITRLKIDHFIDWLHQRNKFHIWDSITSSEEFKAMTEKLDSVTLQEVLGKFQVLIELFEEFEKKIDHQPMAKYWQSYLDMVQILHNVTKSIKIGDWSLHLHATERMLVWLHAYDHQNYSRHFTYYWASQQQLPSTHPKIYEEFQKGRFSTKRTPGNFNNVSPDQVIEQTINKEQKGPGKIIFRNEQSI